METNAAAQQVLLKAATAEQSALLEKLNRADRGHLGRAKVLVLPAPEESGELAYSPLPATWPSAEPYAKAMAVDLPGQVFGAYENGRLVRWGPVSSGARRVPTPPGLYHLNWRSRRRSSTVNPKWMMNWYFNFDSKRGQAFHEYLMPGFPDSHSCIRMLQRDAQWLYEWGEGWTLDAKGIAVVTPGTPVLITGAYQFDQPPPWHSADWWERPIALPALPAPAPTPEAPPSAGRSLPGGSLPSGSLQ